MQVAFIGLGQMGKPMALNVLKRFPGLMVSADNDSSFEVFRAAGAIATRERAQLAEADVVLLSLPNETVVREVLFGLGGLAASLHSGSIVIDTSTTDYTATLDISEKLAQLGLHFLDAPVSGMEARAVDGTLTVMAGGEEAVFAKVQPLIECFASNILWMGACGNGQLSKLINQLLFDINCAALAEILPMAVKLGLDATRIGAIVNTGTGRSYASEFFIPRILANRFSDGYAMKHAYKDLVSGAQISARLGMPLPVLGAATVTYQTALLRGLGNDDKGAMIKVFEQLLSVEFRE